jgi:hypothetical protein
LGMPHGNPLDISTLWFAYYSNLIFWAPYYSFINFERPCLVFSLHICFKLNGTPPVGILCVYERATGEK